MNPQLPENKPYKLLLTIGENKFGQFPYLKRSVVNNKDIKKEGENKTKEIITPNKNWFHGGGQDGGTWDFLFSPSRYSPESYPGFGISIIPVFYWDKQYLDVNVSISTSVSL